MAAPTDTDATIGDEHPVLYEVADHVATITLNRPHRRNAISVRMLQLLGDAFTRADDALVTTAREWAAEIAANAPLAIRAMKRLYRHGLTQDFPSHTHHVLLQTMQLFGTKDFYEGISSFAEGRDPEFRGR